MPALDNGKWMTSFLVEYLMLSWALALLWFSWTPFPGWWVAEKWDPGSQIPQEAPEGNLHTLTWISRDLCEEWIYLWVHRCKEKGRRCNKTLWNYLPGEQALHPTPNACVAHRRNGGSCGAFTQIRRFFLALSAPAIFYCFWKLQLLPL